MIYILDTNIIRKLLFHFPKKGKLFEKVWASLEAGIEADVYISVDECFNELSGQFSKDNDAFKWINDRSAPRRTIRWGKSGQERLQANRQLTHGK